MIGLRPFWRYYGGKWAAAPRYPAPIHAAIVEPFAGAAGYSLRYFARRVVLVEKFAIIAAIWRFLIGVKASEILAIPLVDDIEDLPADVCQEARWLVGMTMNAGAVSPNRKISSGMRRFRDVGGRGTEGWCIAMRARAARQCELIRHWTIIEGDYTQAPEMEATWFIDPPYEKAGVHYKHSSRAIDYTALASWCRSRAGQAIVCEGPDATWLPFRSFGSTTGVSGRRSRESIWTGGHGDQGRLFA